MYRIAAVAVLLGSVASIHAGFDLPKGFEIREIAGNHLATDIQCISLDPNGRIVVAGRGYIRILVDDNGDGIMDRAIPFAEGPNVSAMGLFWEGEYLYFTGDGGLRRFHTKDGDHADGPSHLLRAVKASGEHDAHAIRRGPDGWLYLLCGNSSGIDKKWCGPRSPITDPVAGCVLRFSPDFATTEVVADGYRNPYDFDFNLDGELFTYDSDNERCVSLPWYEGCRFYHVLPGGHYGWRNPQQGEFWRTPPYFYDCVAPIADLGRGSPTGVVCYRHTQFPERYRGAFFLLDWTFGKIHCIHPRQKGATYEGDSEVFLRPTGDDGFAPVGAVVHPATGDLLVAIGGRGTRGAVYRIRYADGLKEAAAKPGLTPIPRTSIDRPADWQALADLAKKGSPLQRRRSVESFARWADEAPSDPALEAAVSNWASPDRAMRQAVTRYFIRQPEVAKWAGNQFQDKPNDAEEWNRPVARKYALLTWIGSQDGIDARVVGRNWFLYVLSDRSRGNAAMTRDSALLLDWATVFVRQMNVGMNRSARGAITEGYRSAAEQDLTPPYFANVAEFLLANFESRDARREYFRLLCLVRKRSDPSSGAAQQMMLGKGGGKMLKSFVDSDFPPDSVHAMTCLTVFDLSDLKASMIANALVTLDEKLDARGMARDRNWPLRIRELHEALAEKLPALNKEILAHPAFGRPDHALFAMAPSFAPLRAGAAEKFLAWLSRHPDQLWTPDHVRVIAALPREKALPILRKHWDELGLRDEILAVMAASPVAEDRARLFEGLASPQLATVRKCLDAIALLSKGGGSSPDQVGSEIRQLLAAHDQSPQGKEGDWLRKRSLEIVDSIASVKPASADRAGWGRLLADAYPAEAAKLTATGVDWSKWEKRLQAISWEAGDASRGKVVFTKQGCAACHAGGRALGPDLRGAGNRYSKRDLFIAVCDPNRDVPARYRTTLVATKTGRSYQGMVVYEAVDGVMLQVGADQTVRIPASDIESRQLQRRSLMPTGLLDPLKDGEIADLYGYLRSLK